MQFNRPNMVNHDREDEENTKDVSERPVQGASQLMPLPEQNPEPEPITEQDINRDTTQTGDTYSVSQALGQDKARDNQA